MIWKKIGASTICEPHTTHRVSDMLGEHRVLPPNTLAVFVDETGDEKLGDPAHPMFAFGGVACVSDQLGQIQGDWRAMKSSVFPQVKGALHAKAHMTDSRLKGVKGLSVLSAMSHPALARFGFVITNNTAVPRDQVIASALISLTLRFDQIANGLLAKGYWNPPGGALIVFEASRRLEKHIEAHLGQLTYTLDGKKHPIDKAFMPKSSADPLLEMADFVAYTLGRNIKHKLVHGRQACTENFEALFRNADPAMRSYVEADAITFRPAA